MTTKLLLTSFFLLLLCTVQAQTIIRGTVTDSENTPLPYATVFLSKTTMGTIADSTGNYSITVKEDGNYEIICSFIGYLPQSSLIKADQVPKRINFRLEPRKMQLSEITITAKEQNRKENLMQFVKCFIGETNNASSCTILNPNDLIIYRSSNDSNLIAYSEKPIEITNNALGYTIFYDLLNFAYNPYTKHIRFSGNYYFKEPELKKNKKDKINRNRLLAYYGSRMHFLRSLFTDSLATENYKLTATRPGKKGIWEIDSTAFDRKNLRLAINTDSMTLYYPHPIIINYGHNANKAYQGKRSQWLYNGIQNKYQTVIYLTDTVHVYKNGYYPNCFNLSWSGNMAEDRVAELLPYDFVPTANSKKK